MEPICNSDSSSPNATLQDERRNAGGVPFATGKVQVAMDVDSTSLVFQPIRAADLSQTGVSFFTTHWPTADRLIIRFGEQEPVSTVRVRIIGCHREDLGNDDCRFEVRCEFVEWL